MTCFMDNRGSHSPSRPQFPHLGTGVPIAATGVGAVSLVDTCLPGLLVINPLDAPVTIISPLARGLHPPEAWVEQ